MSQENAEIVREAMDAYNLGDKDRCARFMDPELETFPVAQFPEPGPLIGPDAAWDFYQRFGDTMAGSELFETAGFETTELIDAGERVFACQRTPLQGEEAWKRSSSGCGGCTRLIRGDGSGPSGSSIGVRRSQQRGCRSSAVALSPTASPPRPPRRSRSLHRIARPNGTVMA